MIWCLFLLLTADVDVANADELWQKANQAYGDGAYAEALEYYRELWDRGVVSGKLHFNLGNAYFKTGRLGKAILHYSRAKRYLPGDADLEANLRLAEQSRRDPLIEGENEPFVRALDKMAWRFSYVSVFYLALAFLILGGLASFLMIVRPQSGKWVGYVLVIASTLGLLIMTSAFLQHRKITRRDAAVIVAAEVSVLSGPSKVETVSFTIHEGISCTILDRTEGWFRIRLANGYNGWVPRDALEII